MLLENNDSVLFQGITDCNRNRDDFEGLGTGYPYMISAWISSMYPEKNINF